MRFRRLISILFAVAAFSLAAHAQDAAEAVPDSSAAKPAYVVDSVFQAKFDAILDSIYAEQNYLMSAADSSIYVPWRDTVVYKIDSTRLAKLTRPAADSVAV
ncbi:MAG: hypothetical protein J5508_03355, partial [Bacteroidales bacterium]|nr:hypothetical protein [Bacteroidales bacterium]